MSTAVVLCTSVCVQLTEAAHSCSSLCRKAQTRSQQLSAKLHTCPQLWWWHVTGDRAWFPAAVRAIVLVTSKAWPRQILRKRVQIYKSQTVGSAWDNSLRLGQMVLQLVAAVQLSRSCATKWKSCRKRSPDWAASEMKGKKLNGSFPRNCNFKSSNFPS